MKKVWTASEMGRIGGKNRWKNSTKKERVAFAMLGVKTRQEKKGRKAK